MGAGLVAHQMGWVDGVLLGRVAAALVLVAGLIATVRLPWDLTFQARNALAQQEASRRRGLEVDEAEMVFAKKSASRSLALALTLHLVGALLTFAARPFLGSELGLVLAAAFIGSMAFRPISAFYQHTRRRLFQAQKEAAVRAPEALTLADADAQLKDEIANLHQELATHREATSNQLAVLQEQTQNEASAWRRVATATDEKVERVLREFERTIERTQQSGEVLAGVRAFVKLVRES